MTDYVLLRDEDKANLLRDELYRVEVDLYRRELAAKTGDPAGAPTGPGAKDYETLQQTHKELSTEYKRLTQTK